MNSGDRISVGGIEADIVIDTANLGPTLDKVRDGLTKVDSAIAAVQNKMQTAGGYTRELESDLGHLVATKETLIAAEQQLAQQMVTTAGVTQTLHTGLQSIHSGAGRAAMGMMQLGYIADDLQYGFKSIVNNIAPAVYSFTGNAGLAAGAQVAGVAIYQLTTRWDDLMGALGAAVPTPALDGLEAIDASLKAINKEIDDLRKKSFLTDIELGNLESAEKMGEQLKATQKEEKAVEKLEGGTKEDRARGSAFVDAIREQGGGDVVRGVLEEEFRKRAATDGRGLDDAEIDKLMRDAGVYSAGGGLDPGILKDSKHFNRERMNALARSLGLDVGFDDVDDTELARGKDARDIIRDRLRGQRYLFDDVSGQMMTPAQMARSRLAEGARGNTVAAEDVGGALDRRFGTRTTVDTANGQVQSFTPSAFSQSFNEASPEGKETAANRKAELEEMEKQRKLNEKEELELADLRIEEAEESGKRITATRQRNTERRHENERGGREAALGIDAIGEALAGQARLGSITPAEAQSRIAAYLKEHGRSDKQATAAAEDIYADSSRKVEEGMVDRFLSGKGKEKSNVEAFSAEEVASKFQASVGGGSQDPQAKTNGLLEDIKKGIDKMAEKTGLTVRFQ